MQTRSSNPGRRLREAASCLIIAALLVPEPLYAQPAAVRDVTQPVSTVTAESLQDLPSSDIKSILDLHNKLRAEVGSPPLQWDPQMAARAADWAGTMAQLGVMQHSPRAGRERERENLVLSRSGTASLARMLQTWSDEKRFFTPGTFPSVCRGDWSTCAHYTQIIWPTTTHVGCGVHYGPQFDALVCRYSPPGNRDGDPVGFPPPIIAQAPVININNPAPVPAPLPPRPASAPPAGGETCRISEPDDFAQLLREAAAKSGFAPQSSDPRDAPTDRQWELALQREQEVQDRLMTELATVQGDVARHINAYLAAASAWQERYVYISSTTTGLQGLLTNWLEAREVYEKADLAFALMNLGVGGAKLGFKAYRFLAARRAAAAAETAQAATSGARTGEAVASAAGDTQAFNRTLLPPMQNPNVRGFKGFTEDALQAARTKYIRDVERTRQALRQAEQAGDTMSAEIYKAALDDLVKKGMPTTAPTLTTVTRVSPEIVKLAEDAGVNVQAISRQMAGKADDLLEWEILRAVAKARGWHDVPLRAGDAITNALIEARKVLAGVDGAQISPTSVNALKIIKARVEGAGLNFANWLRTAAGETAVGAERIMELPGGAQIVKKYEVIDGIVRYYDDVDVDLILKIIDSGGDASKLRNAVSPVTQASLNGLARAGAAAPAAPGALQRAGQFAGRGACGTLDAGLGLNRVGGTAQGLSAGGAAPTEAQLTNVLDGTGQLGQVGLGNVVDQFGITERFTNGQGLPRAMLGELWDFITSPSATAASYYYTNEAQKEYLQLIQNEQGKLLDLGARLHEASNALQGLQNTLQRAGLSGPGSYLGTRGPADLRRALEDLQKAYDSGSSEWQRRHKDQMDDRREHITGKLADLAETVADLNALAARMGQVRNWLDSLRLTPDGKLRGPVELFNPLTFVRLGSISLYLRGVGADMFGLTSDVPFRVASSPQPQPPASTPPPEDWDTMMERLKARSAALDASPEVEVDPGLDAWLNGLNGQ